MAKHETLRNYLRRARLDASWRAHLLENARGVRSASGWGVIVFAVLAVIPSVYDGLRGGNWISSTSIIAILFCALSLHFYDKFGDRIAMLTSMNDVPNHSTEPTSASGTSAAEHPPRQP